MIKEIVWGLENIKPSVQFSETSVMLPCTEDIKIYNEIQFI